MHCILCYVKLRKILRYFIFNPAIYIFFPSVVHIVSPASYTSDERSSSGTLTDADCKTPAECGETTGYAGVVLRGTRTCKSAEK